MLLQYLDNPLLLFASVVALALAISVHEFAHALAADKLGDLTPRYQGRLTLSPLAHLDLVGTLMILIAGFGWGKPVQFNPWGLKNPRRDSALISIAGPVSNFATALILAIAYKFVPSPGNLFLLPLIILNINLGLFNLIPIAPLDGFKVIEGLLPKALALQWRGLERYGFLFLIFLIFPIFGGSLIGSVLLPVQRSVLELLLR